MAQLMQQQIKGAKLHIVPGGAHAAVFEKPMTVGRAITDWPGSMRSASRQ